MPRLSHAYRTLWELVRNPFPDHAVAAAGDGGEPFYEQLHPGLCSQMARAFIGADKLAPKLGFLWSLGHGDDARGYGKTRHLLWFAERINTDLGYSVSRLVGRKQIGKSLAVYASFNTVEGLSLNNLLFDVVRNIVRSHGHRLLSLRAEKIADGRTQNHLYGAAYRRANEAGEDWMPGMLSSFSFWEPKEWTAYIEGFSQWHKVRYGRQLLRACLAFLTEIGIERLLIFVDQVEDFASYTTPSYKLQRDFNRLGYLCWGDKLIGRHVTFVLTMHPRASRIISRYWPEHVLGMGNSRHLADNVVCIGPMTKDRFLALTKVYLASVRFNSPKDSLSPFTSDAIELVYELQCGRPGYCLQNLHFLMDVAAAEGRSRIDRQFVEYCLVGA